MSKDFRFLMYHSDEGDVSVNAIAKDETIWLTQKGMAELFGVEVPAISKRITSDFDREVKRLLESQ